MAALIFLRYRHRRNWRRSRLFLDRTHPLDRYDGVAIYNKFRFRREDTLELTNELHESIEVSNRQGLALRFYATGSFQDVCAALFGVHQSTACRVIRRVTEALVTSRQ